MKKYYLLLVVSALAWSCQTNDVNKSAKPKFTNDELARIVLLDTDYSLSQTTAKNLATDIAARFLTKNDGQPREISEITTVPSLYKLIGKTLIKTDFSISKPETPSLYVVNFKDKKGYVVMSADKRAPGVLAMVGKGAMDSNAHIGLALFLENAIKHVDEVVAKTESFRGDDIYKSMQSKLNLINSESGKAHDGAKVANVPCTATTTTDIVAAYSFSSYIAQPILNTLWDQGPPYNLGQPDNGCSSSGYCNTNSKYLAGCVAVAEGQVVAYFLGKKKIGDWSTIVGTPIACYLSGTQQSEVSTLLHNIYLDYGIFVNRTCGVTGAGLEISDITVTNPRGISPNYGLVTGEWRSWNTGDIRNSLSQGSPV